MADIFDEVSEDLRAERAQRLFQRYWILLIALAVVIVAAVGGWQVWRSRQQAARADTGATFLAAMQDASGPVDAKTPEKAKAEATFAELAKTATGGYRTLARLRDAAMKANGGDLPGALALWDQVSADETADPQLRQLADLLWVQHQVDSAEPALVEGRLVGLLAPNSPWRPLALENQAWLKLRTGDTAAAAAALRQIVALPSAPQGVRARATGLLTRIDPGAGTQG